MVLPCPTPRKMQEGQDRMNTGLKKEHWQRITDPDARRMYGRLCDACERRPGGITDADQMIVADISYMEQIKGILQQDIAERGIGKEVRNGRQTYWQDNKSLAHLRAYSESQRKLLAELRLTPNGRKAASVEIDDEFDAF